MVRPHRQRQTPPLTPQLLVEAYRQGLFPMADGRRSQAVTFYAALHPAILPLKEFHCPQSLRQRMARRPFQIRMDTAFEQTIRACAEPRTQDAETWINDRIIAAYTQLHREGLAHSVEAWRDGQLAGGLYGVALGGAFFGESMFHRGGPGGTDASKISLVHLVQHLQQRGFALLDVQMNSDHLRRFGAVNIPRQEYMERLGQALTMDVTWSAKRG